MDGFLGTRGSFILDLVFVAMICVLPILVFSRYLVRSKHNFRAHRTIQSVVAGVLLVAVLVFEVDMRINGWTHRATASPYWVDGQWNDWIDWTLAIHLCFAIPTPFVWAGLIWAAMRKFPNPPEPNAHAAAHRRWGTIGMLMMALTSITGWAFYLLAFAAK